MRSNRRYTLVTFILGLILLSCFEGCDRGGSGEVKKAPSEPTESAPGEPFAAGAPAPEIELNDLSGKKVSLKDLRGKTVLLNFWATWCVPCVAEMGSLQRLYKAYQSQNFEIVSVNVDSADTQANVEKFVKDNGISFRVFRDPELSYPPVYNLSGFPESFFIGPDGKFLSFFDSGENKNTVRVVGDRAWDSAAFLKAVKDLLGK